MWLTFSQDCLIRIAINGTNNHGKLKQKSRSRSLLRSITPVNFSPFAKHSCTPKTTSPPSPPPPPRPRLEIIYWRSFPTHKLRGKIYEMPRKNLLFPPLLVLFLTSCNLWDTCNNDDFTKTIISNHLLFTKNSFAIIIRL